MLVLPTTLVKVTHPKCNKNVIYVVITSQSNKNGNNDR